MGFTRRRQGGRFGGKTGVVFFDTLVQEPAGTGKSQHFQLPILRMCNVVLTSLITDWEASPLVLVDPRRMHILVCLMLRTFNNAGENSITSLRVVLASVLIVQIQWGVRKVLSPGYTDLGTVVLLFYNEHFQRFGMVKSKFWDAIVALQKGVYGVLARPMSGLGGIVGFPTRPKRQ